MPVFSAGSLEFAQQRVNIFGFPGIGWLAMAGARKLVGAKPEARPNALRVAMLAAIARDF